MFFLLVKLNNLVSYMMLLITGVAHPLTAFYN